MFVPQFRYIPPSEDEEDTENQFKIAVFQSRDISFRPAELKSYKELKKILSSIVQT